MISTNATQAQQGREQRHRRRRQVQQNHPRNELAGGGGMTHRGIVEILQRRLQFGQAPFAGIEGGRGRSRRRRCCVRQGREVFLGDDAGGGVNPD
jgi:hypothetical protein